MSSFHRQENRKKLQSIITDINVENTYSLLTREEIERSENIFKMIDVDHSGTVTLEEILAYRDSNVINLPAISDLQIEDWLLRVDIDGDGELDMEKFAIFLLAAESRGQSPLLVFKNREVVVYRSFRSVIWMTLDDPSYSRTALIVGIFMSILIVLSVVGFCIETMPAYETNPKLNTTANAFSYITASFFTLELVLRVFSAPSLKAFFFNIYNIFDICAIIPFYWNLAGGTPNSVIEILKAVKLCRLFRLLKLPIFSSWFGLFKRTLAESWIPMTMASMVVLIYVIIISSVMFFTEMGNFHDGAYWIGNTTVLATFQSIPDVCYFTVLTITTVGYGDLVPDNVWGKAVGIFMMVSGMLILAMPISIFDLNFQREYEDLIAVESHLLQRQQELESIEKELHPILNPNKKKKSYRKGTSSASLKVLPMSLSKAMSFNEGGGFSVQTSMSLTDSFALALQSMDQVEMKKFSEREAFRRGELKAHIQELVFNKRRKLWAEIRLLERQHRERILKRTMWKRHELFLQSDEAFEDALLRAVTRIQAAFRGNALRMSVAAKLLQFREKLRNKARRFSMRNVEQAAIDSTSNDHPNNETKEAVGDEQNDRIRNVEQAADGSTPNDNQNNETKEPVGNEQNDDNIAAFHAQPYEVVDPALAFQVPEPLSTETNNQTTNG